MWCANELTVKNMKSVLATFAITAWAASAFAIPTLVIQDGGAINAIDTSIGGVVTVNTSDGFWRLVITTGIASPPAPGGTATAPILDLSISATSANGSENNPLKIYLGSDGFGPTSAAWLATMTGHIEAGSGANVGFGTYYNTGNAVSSLGTPLPPGSTLLTASGNVSGPSYSNTQTGAPVTLGSPYALIESVTIDGGVLGGQYSLEASLVTTTVPDGGTTAMLLGAALSVLGLIRRKLA
jgi:hypothetical protein